MFHYELKNGRIEVFAHKGAATRKGRSHLTSCPANRDLPANVAINLKMLAENGKPGRFSPYPTMNIFTFLLLDQEDGRTWQVQMGETPSERQILAIT
jgi:hypothetical protein